MSTQVVLTIYCLSLWVEIRTRKIVRVWRALLQIQLVFCIHFKFMPLTFTLTCVRVMGSDLLKQPMLFHSPHVTSPLMGSTKKTRWFLIKCRHIPLLLLTKVVSADVWLITQKWIKESSLIELPCVIRSGISNSIIVSVSQCVIWEVPYLLAMFIVTIVPENTVRSFLLLICLKNCYQRIRVMATWPKCIMIFFWIRNLKFSNISGTAISRACTRISYSCQQKLFLDTRWDQFSQLHQQQQMILSVV